MGLLDKVKEQAGQIAEKAQQGVTQGKDKLEEIQVHKKGDGLLRDLGAAYFAQVRQNGPKEAVDAALAAMDAHVAEHGQHDATTTVDLTDPPPV
jgi:hypothetical protein